MSGRHRQVKRRIRELEQSIQHARRLAQSYEIVITDCAGYSGSLELVIKRLDWHRMRIGEWSAELQRENELLATMPKRHGASPHDPGDESPLPQRQERGR